MAAINRIIIHLNSGSVNRNFKITNYELKIDKADKG